MSIAFLSLTHLVDLFAKDCVLANMFAENVSRLTPKRWCSNVGFPEAAIEDWKCVTIISFCSQKGGVSKSSLARALAVEAARTGLIVKIADLDVGQGSTVDWHKDRVARGFEPSVAVQLHRGPKEAIVQAGGIDLLVIDGPARADKDTIEIARLSDLVVLPTGASLDDLRPGIRTANSLKAAGISLRHIVFALSRIGTEAEADAARAYIDEAGYRTVPGYIPERPAFRAIQNEGRSISEVRYASLRASTDIVVQALVDAVVVDEKEIGG